MDSRSDWRFKKIGDCAWIWEVTRPDGTRIQSDCTYLTRTECIAEATRLGYIAWIPEAERRRQHGFGTSTAQAESSQQQDQPNG